MSCERTADENGLQSFFKSNSPVFNMPVNGTVDVDLQVGGYTPTWLWGDSSLCERGDPVTHVYDEVAPYSARIGDIDRSRIRSFILKDSAVDNIDLESFRQLNYCDISNNDLNSVDISRNNALMYLDISNNGLTTANIDEILIQIDAFELVGGTLIYGGNSAPSNDSLNAFLNLICKRWTLIGPPVTGVFSITIDTRILTGSNSTGDHAFYFPGFGNYDIHWGDCKSDFGVDREIAHTYTTAGIKTIIVVGDLQRVTFENEFDRQKVLSLNSWGPSIWSTMKEMFQGCINMTANTVSDQPNMSNVTDLEETFNLCQRLTSLDVSGFDTSNVTIFKGLFDGCFRLEALDVSGFDTSKATTFQSMFRQCTSLASLDITNFNSSLVRNMTAMFETCAGLTTIDLSNLDTSEVTIMNNMFNACEGLTSLDVTNFNTSKVAGMASMFSNIPFITSLDVSSFDTSNVETMFGMFREMIGLISIDLSTFNTAKVESMGRMFNDCTTLTTLDLASFNTSSCTRFDEMFRFCEKLTSINTIGFNTSAGTNFDEMFEGCFDLLSINLLSFNTANATNMDRMFKDCQSLTSLNVSSFDTSNVTTMIQMFRSCQSLTSLNVSSFDTSSVTSMFQMFVDCHALITLDVSGFDTVNVTNMHYMFKDCTLLDVDVSIFNIESLTTAQDMFEFSSFSNTNYDLLLPAWNNQVHNNNVLFHAGTAKYSAGAPASARGALVVDGWTIIDGGPL